MRKKVKLAFIAHDSTRRATFTKRKKSLLKKVNELSILCAVPACAIVYGENESKPELWPNSPMSVHQVISKFQEMPLMEQSKKKLNQESFLRQRIAKTEEQLKKMRNDNREREMTNILYCGVDGMLAPGWLDGLSLQDLNDLNLVINKTLNEIDEKQEMLGEPGSMKKVTAEATEKATEEAVPVDPNNMEPMQGEEWLKNLMEPLEPAIWPLEDSINPSSPMWLNPFLP
ncbi:agamous-like MADS-box protein AGL80 [Punica granatum]|uniref:Agamous-like MADS-box protein AGL80 n=2 Tax=Punica granatum TaxID=22663 RepID=A0A6P8ENN5_PUNGR|nr:agamous-like MADS-box protein AGL80 [Punica granatum]PKI48162.1 hypothetical protein CRG98_031427 [Punica granatum]